MLSLEFLAVTLFMVLSITDTVKLRGDCKQINANHIVAINSIDTKISEIKAIVTTIAIFLCGII
jgi:hypothetical protein